MILVEMFTLKQIMLNSWREFFPMEIRTSLSSRYIALKKLRQQVHVSTLFKELGYEV